MTLMEEHRHILKFMKDVRDLARTLRSAGRSAGYR